MANPSSNAQADKKTSLMVFFLFMLKSEASVWMLNSFRAQDLVKDWMRRRRWQQQDAQVGLTQCAVRRYKVLR